MKIGTLFFLPCSSLCAHETKSIILTDTCQEAKINFDGMIADPELILLIILFFWSVTLTVLFFRFYLYYTRLIKPIDKRTLLELLDILVKNDAELKKVIDHLSGKYDTLENEGKRNIQKVGLLRFNPFNDTGGDQSFILALLNGENTGVVVSSLHTRSGTRWYAKEVKGGKGTEHVLSTEEEKAVQEAKKISK